MSDDLFDKNGYVTVHYNKFGVALDAEGKVPSNGTTRHAGVSRDIPANAPLEDDFNITTDTVVVTPKPRNIIKSQQLLAKHRAPNPVVSNTLVPQTTPVEEKVNPLDEVTPLQDEDIEDLDSDTAIMRTQAGDIIYSIEGIDCTSKSFIVLYLKNNFHFKPKAGKIYWFGVKTKTQKILVTKVFYSGILFDLLTPGALSVMVLHIGFD